MDRWRKILLWSALCGTAILAVLSTVGAFLAVPRVRQLLGFDSAKDMFNCIPLAVFWIAMLILLAISPLASARIRRRVGSLAMHIGPILILAGAMLGSGKAFDLARDHFQDTTIPSGRMQVFQGQETGTVYRGSDKVSELPFRLRLNSFRVVWYPWEMWAVSGTPDESEASKHEQIPWQVGGVCTVPYTATRMRVLEYLDSHPDTGLPAIRVRLTRSDGKTADHWLIVPSGLNPATDEPFDMAGVALGDVLGATGRKVEDKTKVWLARGDAPVRQFESDVSVLMDGREVARQVISVNHPMRYGGYSFTQDDFDKDKHQFTVLGVRSDRGVSAVFIGMAMLCAGAVWFFWGVPVVAFFRRKGKPDGD